MKFKSTIVLVILLVLCSSAFALAADRSEQLVVMGGMWGPASSWNPLYPPNVAGTLGFVYETLFHYDSLNNELTPWVAKEGEWVSDNVYQVTLRDGVTFSDGVALTAEDVVFTYELARDNDLTYSPLWRNLAKVTALDKLTVKFEFDNPNYQEWNNELYSRALLPKHTWKDVPSDELMSITNREAIGSGPYTAGFSGPDRMVWTRNDNWWGNDVFGQPVPKEVIHLVATSNNVALSMLMQGHLDISNNFLPGINAIKDSYGLLTWYQDAPYMLSANVAVLYINSTRPPLDDPVLRRAMAFAIDPTVISERAYSNMVPVADSTGLFAGWSSYRDDSIADQYGFSFDPEQANALLDEAGYVDKDNDGWRDQPDGSPMSFSIIVPSGWTDWEESIRIIGQHLRAVGINANPQFPDFGVYQTRMHTAEFDLLINNFGSGISGSPYTYWNWAANHNINREQVTEGNFGRYDNPELFDIIEEFNYVQPMSDESLALASQIQETLLKDMPSIPLWLNGMWGTLTEINWTNWPTEANPVGYPCFWGNSMELGTIEMLINLKPVK